MATMTNLLVKDDATTPIEYTFVPISDTPNPFWRTALSGVPIDGQHRLTASVVKQKNGNYKITAKLEVCIMETLGASGASSGYVAPPKVAYTIPVIITMFADKRSTIADRANAIKFAVAAVAGASSTTATAAIAVGAAGDVTKNSVLPLPYLFTNLVLPS